MTSLLTALTRPVARALVGAPYVVLGGDAAITPGGRVDQAAPLLASLRKVVPVPLSDEAAVRANGAAQAAAGGLLALGIAPRTSALVLAGSLVPTTMAGHAFWTVEDPAARKMQRVQFLKNVTMVGGLVVVALGAGAHRR